mgnify:CR=1 FL=1
MRMMNYGFLLLLLVPMYAAADNAYDFGDYTVYYNAFTADSLPPEMASAYGIERSKYKGVLNISVQQKGQAGVFLPKAVDAAVSVDAVNLVGQLKKLKMRRISEGESIYYISEFRISNEELLEFNVVISPVTSSKPLTFEFKQKFYVD